MKGQTKTSFGLTLRKRSSSRFRYDVCLSFAKEDRSYVRQFAAELVKHGFRVFFDEYAQAELWGKDLYTHLDDIYQNAARHCVLFVSRHYARRVWTNHERESAQARAIREHSEYILPAHFDSTKIPGLRPTVGRVDLKKIKPSQLANLFVQKAGRPQRENYFPPTPDRLFAKMKAKSSLARRRIAGRANNFFQALSRMTEKERHLVFSIFLNGCPADLPNNIHINLDLLRRVTGVAPSKAIRILEGLRSLGFDVNVRKNRKSQHGHEGGLLVALEWQDMSVNWETTGNATAEVDAMIECVAGNYCSEHALEALMLLDFSRLATSSRSQSHEH